MVVITFTTIGTSSYWKVQGPLILMSFIVACASYAAYGAIRHNILMKNPILLAFSGLGIVYIGLSYGRLLPSEPIFFMQEYILRMGYFTIALYPVTAAFFLLFHRIASAGSLKNLAIVGIISTVFAAFVTYLSPPYDGTWVVEGMSSGLVESVSFSLNYSLNNLAILFWWSLTLLSRNFRFGIFAIFVMLMLADSAQMKLLALVLALVWFLSRPLKWSVPMMATIVIGFPAIAMTFASLSGWLDADPNTVHRANWWGEALLAMVGSGGFGLGFGADSTRDFAVADRFDMLGKWGQLPIHVVHNDYIYCFYAMGLVGGLLFLAFHFKYLAPRWAPDLGMARHAVLMMAAVCLSISTNSALISPQLLLGVCWTFGYLLFLNSFGRPAR